MEVVVRIMIILESTITMATITIITGITIIITGTTTMVTIITIITAITTATTLGITTPNGISGGKNKSELQDSEWLKSLTGLCFLFV